MKNLNYEKIGKRLKNLRKYMGLSQQQVASILNIGRDAVIRIEQGNRKIDAEELANFSKLYNISIDELISNGSSPDNTEVAFARGFYELSEKDKKEILSLIEYKNIMKSKNKELLDDSRRISE